MQGGLSLGLHLAGWQVCASIEIEANAVETHKLNLPDVNVLNEDVCDLDFRQFQDVDLVAGGPPCQPFSVAGKQLAKSDDRDMVPQFIRAVDEIRPRAFLMENVPGLLTEKHKQYKTWVIDKFHSLGYTVHLSVLDAAYYGVPQHRKRVFFVGFRDSDPFRFPVPTHGKDKIIPFFTAGQALEDVPDDEPNTAKVVYAKNPILRPSPWAGMLVNGKGRPINLAEPSRTIPASAGGESYAHYGSRWGVI